LASIQASISAGGNFVLLATGSLIGEGFDLPVLDTLFLAMPISFKGKLVQYTGRLNREYPNKSEILVYDYVDPLPLTLSMHLKRLKAFKGLGFETNSSQTLF
jgi:superfamily II DNA or RNA helicase